MGQGSAREGQQGGGQKPTSPKYHPQLPNHRKNVIFMGSGKLEPPNSTAPKMRKQQQVLFRQGRCLDTAGCRVQNTRKDVKRGEEVQKWVKWGEN